ncbi:portal protein [Kiloniella litopenaei]|uniref:portal protein n=1 Tax=Kiloniella litopenaei TaxID=1549748 RepID=UPI003BAC3501
MCATITAFRVAIRIQIAQTQAAEKITVYEAYIRMDHDGDGIAELRRVVCGGNAYTILENEAVDQHPYSLTCPSWTSHKNYR